MDQGVLNWFDRNKYEAAHQTFPPEQWRHQLIKRRNVELLLLWAGKDAEPERIKPKLKPALDDLADDPLAYQARGRDEPQYPTGHPSLHRGAVFSPPAGMMQDVMATWNGEDPLAPLSPPDSDTSGPPNRLMPCMVNLSLPPSEIKESFDSWLAGNPPKNQRGS